MTSGKVCMLVGIITVWPVTEARADRWLGTKVVVHDHTRELTVESEDHSVLLILLPYNCVTNINTYSLWTPISLTSKMRRLNLMCPYTSKIG